METKIEKKSNGHGGARPGAGRKKGSKDNVTVKHLLEVLDAKSKGQSYEEILIDDFLTARLNNDQQLVLKYHNLISSKLIPTLNEIDVGDNEDAVLAKQQAFAEALTALVAVNKKDAK